jgi:hypothetical protein
MKKNLRTLGTILSLVAITSFTMTSCGAQTEEATTEAAPAETPAEETPEVIEEPAKTCDAACGGEDTPAEETPAAQ